MYVRTSVAASDSTTGIGAGAASGPSPVERRQLIKVMGATSSLMAAAQHVVGLCSFAIFPIIIAEASGLSVAQKAAVFQTSFLALAIANVLHTANFASLGTTHLVPSGYTAIYLAPSLMAVHIGGLPLVMGMTVLSGVLEIVVAGMLTRIRGWITNDVLGVILVLVGLTNAMAGLKRLPVSGFGPETIIAAVALGVMVVATLINRLSVFAVLLGVTTGYLLALRWNMIDLSDLGAVPLFASPQVALPAPQFDGSLVIPFALVALIAAIKQTAFVEHAQRLDGAAPSPSTARRSVACDGVSTIAAGLLGSLGVNASASSAGIKVSTGLTDRRLGWIIAMLLIALSFLPQFALLAAKLPISLVASVLIYSAVFVIASGLNELNVGADRSRSLVAGMGLLTGFAAEIRPFRLEAASDWLSFLLASPLVVGSSVAILLSIAIEIKSRTLARIANRQSFVRG